MSNRTSPPNLVVETLWNTPSRRLHLDWYVGPIQSVLSHETHGTWYVFATLIGAAGERRYAMLPLDDDAIFEELGDLETRDETNWLQALGRDTLLPRCEPSGLWVTTRDDVVQSVRAMTEEERNTVVPIGLHDLLAP
jgi:hypothetical protein